MVPTFSHCFYPPMTLVLAHYKYGPQTCHLQFRSISHLQIIVEFYPLRLRWLSGYGPAIKLARVNRTSLGTNRNLYSMVTLIRIGRRPWLDQRFCPTTTCVVTQTVPVFVTFLLQMELGVRFLCQGVWGCLQIASRLFGLPYLQLIVRRPLLFVTETWRPSPSHQRSEESLRCYTMLNGHRWNCCWWHVNRWHVERWRWKVERWPPSKRTGRQRRRTACKTRTPQKCTK